MKTEQIKNDLENLSEYLDASGLYSDKDTVQKAIKTIETLEKGLDIYQRERNRWKHNNPTITGVYFLTGGHGATNENFLPEYVTICPAYGAGWEQVYKRTEQTISYEGS